MAALPPYFQALNIVVICSSVGYSDLLGIRHPLTDPHPRPLYRHQEISTRIPAKDLSQCAHPAALQRCSRSFCCRFSFSPPRPPPSRSRSPQKVFAHSPPPPPL